MEFTLTLNGFTVETRQLGVSRCEFMGLGHPLSKVYLRRPRRALSGDFFVIARRILSSPIYLIVLGDPCSGEIRMRYRYSDWSAESSNLNWSTGARDLKWLETSYCGTLFMGTPFMWTKFLIAVHYVLCKDPGTLFHRFTWKDFIFLIKNFHVQPDRSSLFEIFPVYVRF